MTLAAHAVKNRTNRMNWDDPEKGNPSTENFPEINSLRPPPNLGSMISVQTQSRPQHHQSGLFRDSGRPGRRHDREARGPLLVARVGPSLVCASEKCSGEQSLATWQSNQVVERSNTTHAISRTRSSVRSNTRLGAGTKNCALPSDQMTWSCVGERNTNNLRNLVDCGLVRENLRLLLGPISKEERSRGRFIL